MSNAVISPYTGRPLPTHAPTFINDRHRNSVYKKLGVDPHSASIQDYWMANHKGRVEELRALGVL